MAGSRRSHVHIDKQHLVAHRRALESLQDSAVACLPVMVVKAASQVQDHADHRAAGMPLRAATQRLARGTAVTDSLP